MTARPADPSDIVSTRVCTWCGRAFVRRSRMGRPPLYCTENCRKRAYDRRHAVVPPLRRRDAVPLRKPGIGASDWLYERGISPGADGTLPKVHAVRPATFPDHDNRRASLCGASVRVAGAMFFPLEARACQPCRTLAQRYPRPQPVGRGADVAQIEAAVSHADLMVELVARELARGVDPGRVTEVLLSTVDEVLRAIRPWHTVAGQLAA